MSDNFELLDETNPGLNLVSLGHHAPTHCSLQSLAGHGMVKSFYCGFQPKAKYALLSMKEINTYMYLQYQKRDDLFITDF